MKKLIELLLQYKGSIVCTSSLTPEQINQARAADRMYVDENGYGFVWEPDSLIPTTEEEVELFEKWYPLPVECPEHLKNCDWLWKRLEIEKQKKQN